MLIGLDVRMLALQVFRVRGVGRYVTELVNHLKQVDCENEYALLTSTQDYLPWQENLVQVGPFPTYSKNGFWEGQLRLPLTLARQNLNLVHFPFAEIAPAWTMPGQKMVLTVHDLMRFQELPKHFKESLFYKFFQRALRSADAIITVSEYVKNQVTELLGKNHPPVTAILHGVDHKCFRVYPRDVAFAHVAERFEITGPFILYTGGFDGRKQVAKLVHTFHDLIHQAKISHTLVLAGRMEAYESFIELMRAIVECRLQGRVIFTDYVSDDELVQLYNAADVFAFPSSGEGFGLPLLEAMACGTPIVTFRNSSIPEVVGDAGILAADGDWNEYTQNLQRLLKEPGVRDMLSLRGQARASMFTWDVTARKTLGVYANLFHAKSF